MLSFLFKGKNYYEIDAESKVIYLKYIGEVSSDSFISLNKKILNDPQFDKSYACLVDVRKTKQLFEPHELSPFLNFFKSNQEVFQGMKIAFLISSPKQSLTIDHLDQLFKANQMNVHFKKAINAETALKWIKESHTN